MKNDLTTTELGRFGEKAAATFLKKKGYRILETNFRAGKNEIDIIASRKKEIVFVEVKTRTLSALGDLPYGAPLEAVEEDIRSCGLFHVKAQNIIDASRMLVEEFDGRLPDTMEELLRFPGVGRKVANLLLGDIYRIPGVVTDTHCIRICGRLGMYPESEKNPPKIERILAELIAPEEQTDFCHRIVWFGRDTCTARTPACETCPLGEKGICLHRENG